MEIPSTGLLPEALLLGIPHIDAQHEEIFYRVEALKAACLETGTLPDDMAEELLVCLRIHFASEEECAREAGIEFAEHASIHRATLKTLGHSVERVRAGHANVFSLLRYLEAWFERHIVDEDLPLGRMVHAAHQATGD
jgi:hemerythrin-like metal-binding protein